MANTQFPTEFSGGDGVVAIIVGGATQTQTIQCLGLTTIRSVSVTPVSAPTADAALIIASATTNIVTVKQYTAQNTLNTQTARDFYLTVVGEY